MSILVASPVDVGRHHHHHPPGSQVPFPAQPYPQAQGHSAAPECPQATRPKRVPRKSILKSQRPVLPLRALRPLPQHITDRFPLELVRIVIDWLAVTDKPTLHACTLVCRSWLPMCRAYYGRMTVTSANAHLFLEIAGGRSLTIDKCVGHLTIQKQENVIDHFFLVRQRAEAAEVSGKQGHSPSSSTSSPHSPLTPAPLVLTHVLERAMALTSITKLTLQKGYGETAAIASYLRQGFPALDHLELRSFEFGCFSDLTAVISAQPKLRRLALTDIAWGATPVPSPATTDFPLPPSPIEEEHVPPPGLRHIEFYMEHQARVFNWMLATSRPASRATSRGTPPAGLHVERVELGGIMEIEDAIAVSRFLRGLGPTLKHLRLYTPNRISQVNLVHNTGLQTLVISHLHLTPPSAMPPSPTSMDSGVYVEEDQVCTILSQLCSPSLRTISLQLLVDWGDPSSYPSASSVHGHGGSSHGHGDSDASTADPLAMLSLSGAIDWHEVGKMLALPRYRNLRTVEFRIPGWRRWMTAVIEKCIPGIAEKGILVVTKG